MEYDSAKYVLSILNNVGSSKITFTGGEPLLYPFLGDLLAEAKNYDFTTMIVTNGSLLTDSFLQQYHPFIDWIGISIDSFSEASEKALGRGTGDHVKNALKAIKLVQKYNIKLKVNTVVTRLNYTERMDTYIETIKPDRWKVFQVLSVEGENDGTVEPLLITKKQFMTFVENHQHLNPIYEPNDLMRGSYVMLDPLGRFFQNSSGYIKYSSSILTTDPFEALAQVGWDEEKFIQRGGEYEW